MTLIIDHKPMPDANGNPPSDPNNAPFVPLSGTDPVTSAPITTAPIPTAPMPHWNTTEQPRSSNAMIQINALTKVYRDLTAVRDLNLTIEKGDVFGFIGPNGAGKTTTIKVLATLLEPSSGNAYVDGIDVVRNPLEVRRVIGYMPDFFGVYDDVKVWEYLDFFAAAYKIPVNKRKGIIDDVLELTDLTGKREAYVESLSRGMKQRLCLAKTLVHDPKVLLLDEPASGLDPRARIEFRALLKELQLMGKTIFVSSHILPELADFCNVVGIMERGRLVVAGRVNDIVQRLEGHILLDVRFTGDPAQGERALSLIKAQPHVKDAQVETNHLTIEFTGSHDELPMLLTTLVQNGIPVATFSQRQADLEDVFMKVTKGIVQ
jgi:ABC-2 type transport system ATP-binding protein